MHKYIYIYVCLYTYIFDRWLDAYIEYTTCIFDKKQKYYTYVPISMWDTKDRKVSTWGCLST